ncbi:FlgO family outer membrane protein [Leptospira ilyithenensis]|nr:FlgO family outer membrane protein [Leptospira ilyithenensis]
MPFRFFIFCLFAFVLSCSFDDRESRPPKLTPPLEQLAVSLSEKGLMFNKQRLIVLTFTGTDGGKNQYGPLLSEKLTTELVKKDRFHILDRMVHERALKEKGLSLETNGDMATLRKIGEELKVDILVTGIVSAYQDGLFVNTRLIEIKSGLILKAEEVFVPIDL